MSLVEYKAKATKRTKKSNFDIFAKLKIIIATEKRTTKHKIVKKE